MVVGLAGVTVGLLSSNALGWGREALGKDTKDADTLANLVTVSGGGGTGCTTVLSFGGTVGRGCTSLV